MNIYLTTNLKTALLETLEYVITFITINNLYIYNLWGPIDPRGIINVERAEPMVQNPV